MADSNYTAPTTRTLLEDTLQRLGQARLAMSLARDLLDKSTDEINAAQDAVRRIAGGAA
jgi:hypothetical protein